MPEAFQAQFLVSIKSPVGLRAKPKYSAASEKKFLAPNVSEEITTTRFYFCSSLIITVTKFSKSDWLSTVLILALIGRCNGTVSVNAHSCLIPLNGLFSLLAKKTLGISCVLLRKLV